MGQRADSSGSTAAAAPPDTAAKVAFLRSPAAWPPGAGEVRVIETHMSWVFMTRAFVYKMKKPVRTPFLDFSTLERRHHFCLEEVRLNRRLAPDVYLGVTPLLRLADGSLALGETRDGGIRRDEGTAVEWLVHSRRLPAARMLDRALRERRADAAAVRPLAARLARFYASLPPLDLSAETYVERLRAAVELNHAILSRTAFGLDRGTVDRLADGLRGFLRQHGATLGRPATDRRIVEGHGDLRPEHVCLTSPPVVIDCLEFNRAFRELDPVDELGFLAMECELLDGAFVGPVLFEAYVSATGDRFPPALGAFYQAGRAQLRARLCIAHLEDHRPAAERRRWRDRARRYLDRGIARIGG